MSKPRSQIHELHPYEPGLPLEEIAAEYGIPPEKVVKLASNENPHGPSPKALQVMKTNTTAMHRYPDQHHLLSLLANYHNLNITMLVLGNGSNDVLDLIARTYLGPGDEAISSQYSFIVYQMVTQAVGAKNVVVPARQHGHDLAGMLRSVTPATKVIWIANPNNPTGTFIPYSELYEFLKQIPAKVLVVLDEAYYEYLKPEARVNSVDWLAAFPNLIVVRTFSKIYGLAGLRIGYGMTSADVAGYLNRVRQPFNANALALAAAGAALSDQEFITKSYLTNLAVRDELVAAFTQRGLEYVPAYGNFVTFTVPHTAIVHQSLLRLGVITRPLGGYGMSEWLRVTVGLPAENQQFIHALDKVLAD